MRKKDKNNTAIDLIDAALKKMGVIIRQDISFLEPEFYIGTGSISLDHILSDKCGIPPGIIELYGAEGVGKSTLALEILSGAQQIGLTCYYFDVEKKLTNSLLQTIEHLDCSQIKFPAVNHGNDVIHALDVILPQDPKSVIVIDSIPAMISSEQFQESSDKDFYASIPRLLNTFLPKARTWVRQHQSLLILLNQTRDNINAYGPASKTRTPGGKALKFNADIRLEIRKVGRITHSDEVIGQKIKIESKKNNYAKPFQSVELSLIYGHGIDKLYELQELGLQFGLIEKSGSWFTYEEHKVQGISKLIELLQNKEIQQKLKKQIEEFF